MNDATVNAAPIRPKKVYLVSDSTLKLPRSKSKGGYQGPELVTTEKLNILGIDEAECSIDPGVEIRHVVETCSNFTTKER